MYIFGGLSFVFSSVNIVEYLHVESFADARIGI
jgi:hypothetical protein